VVDHTIDRSPISDTPGLALGRVPGDQGFLHEIVAVNPARELS
jgi:hypothetical protein